MASSTSQTRSPLVLRKLKMCPSVGIKSQMLKLGTDALKKSVLYQDLRKKDTMIALLLTAQSK